jgi:hypothetical protein
MAPYHILGTGISAVGFWIGFAKFVYLLEGELFPNLQQVTARSHFSMHSPWCTLCSVFATRQTSVPVSRAYA